jgi:hypothetical protein
MIIPIGKNCFPELILRFYNLYGEATPLGAIHNVENIERYKEISGIYGFKGKMELIINNFENYLEIHDLEVILENDCTPPEHMVIGNKRTGLSIYHTFPAVAGGEIESFYFSAKEKFDKRIKSFYSKINNARKILIIFIDCNWNNGKEESYINSYNNTEYIDNNVILEQAEKLHKVYPEKTIHYLFLEHDRNKVMGEIDRIQLNENIIRYRANHIYLNKNTIWSYNKDNSPKEYEIIAVEKILSKIKLNENYFQRSREG